MKTLSKARILTSGVGRTRTEGGAPAVVKVGGKGRVIVFSFGMESSGVPKEWAPSSDRPGVNLLPDLSEAAVSRIGTKVRAIKRPGDVVVASVHWGGNWGYDISGSQRRFAHLLLDRAGFDLVHGHSSHHAKGIEVHQGKLILYGCGDLITDYEGIGGYEEFRGDLRIMYFVRIDTETVCRRQSPV